MYGLNDWDFEKRLLRIRFAMNIRLILQLKTLQHSVIIIIILDFIISDLQHHKIIFKKTVQIMTYLNFYISFFNI